MFRNGSKTYYNSSKKFPKDIREDVSILYGFVRVADNYVDSIPQKREEFLEFKEMTVRCLRGEKVDNDIIISMVDLCKRKNINEDFLISFLNSMESDMNKNVYYTVNETIDYMYGSAEVIGLIMSRIMDLDSESLHYARLLGRTMQYINFIRDLDEDQKLNRQYLPVEDMKTFGLDSLQYEEAIKNRDSFISFMRFEIDRYREWIDVAKEGFALIPRDCRIPIMTATDMYLWTAKVIYEDPLIVYRKKVKPFKIRIIASLLKNKLISSRLCKMKRDESTFRTMEEEFLSIKRNF
ncbi:phytoene/squalene synthase family protein [Cuniculiplasma divulgatum]|uniref:phytoene/squalene synthase family protein n=1 Tax=Cuniculiplasma divulgatum TaxID=1673428 RepID=UPI002410FDD7|nr:phytoene/squalene synthase family protein [Cuniculiplasma divulgatum]WMT50364.1 MAG: phytoene/squalene synthase family protein [Thermoplasmatales archaeon]